MSLATIVGLLAKISVMLIVFAIGMKATLADATYLFRRPTELVKALVSMYLVLPLFALLVTSIFDLSLPVEIALIVLSISPVPPILPNKALKAGGQADYTIGVLVTASFLSVFLIPLAIQFFELVKSPTLTLAMGPILSVVLSTVLAPLAAGLLFRAVVPSLAERFANPVSRVGTIMLTIAVIPILLISARAFLTLLGDGTLLAFVSLAIVGLISGHLLGGPDPDNRPVLALASSSRHPAIALTLAQASFPNEKLIAPCVFIYVVLTAFVAVPYLSWNKRTQAATDTTEKQVSF